MEIQMDAWEEENLALRERIGLTLTIRGISLEEMSQLCRVSVGLVRGVIEDRTLITHPRIAARILSEAGIRDRNMLKHLTNKCRWGRLPKRIRKMQPPKVLQRIRENAKEERDRLLIQMDYRFADEVRQNVSERRYEFLDWWKDKGVSEDTSCVPIYVDRLMYLVGEMGWDEPTANRRFGYKARDGFAHVLKTGTTTRSRVEHMACALYCKLDDLIDERALTRLRRERLRREAEKRKEEKEREQAQEERTRPAGGGDEAQEAIKAEAE